MPLAPAPAPAGAALSCSTLMDSTYRRLAAVCGATPRIEVAAVRSPTRQGWTSGAELAYHPELLEGFLAAEAAGIEELHGRPARPDVVASRALHACLWAACLLIAGPWYLERRVPLARPEDIRFSRTTAGPAVVPGPFVCLPDDPAAGLPGVTVAPDENALRHRLRETVADHVRPLLAALGPRLRRGPRALWGMVGDDLVSAVWHTGRMLGDEERAVYEAGLLLPGPVGPFHGGADFRRLTGRDGRSYPTRTRRGCCLYYAIRPDAACATCPRTDDAERLRRLEEPGA
ncbi:(2Fe-2S)-binding protein [Streptomyces sp. NPDC006798]|uniref:(2Fe-2S)-binding protein n=1 Tax=Streptomyces sp. NPDC006798 TaxID=3155462 RepID=UPI0033FBCC6B